MMGRQSSQMEIAIVDLGEMVPKTHLLKRIDGMVDFSFIYEKAESLYSSQGRPSIDPVLLVKMLLIGYLYGIKSERRLEEEVKLNLAYRWFCGLGLSGKVPDHSTFSQNRRRRFRDSGLFEEIFVTIVARCVGLGLIDGELIACDGTVNEDGQREVIGAAEGMKEDKESWRNFLVSLKERGLTGTRLFIGDKCLGLLDAINTVFPNAKYQRCNVHFYRNVFSVVPRGKMKDVAAMLKAIHAQEDKAAAQEKAKAVFAKLKEMKLKEAAKKVEDSVAETLTYMAFPREHWLKIRSNNAIERLNREIRRRTRVVGSFPDAYSALMLVCARLRYMEDSLWGSKHYLNMKHLKAMEKEAEMAANLEAG